MNDRTPNPLYGPPDGMNDWEVTMVGQALGAKVAQKVEEAKTVQALIAVSDEYDPAQKADVLRHNVAYARRLYDLLCRFTRHPLSWDFYSRLPDGEPLPAPSAPAESERQRCPRCGSPAPNLHPAVHPAVQHEGEVQPCSDPWHGKEAGPVVVERKAEASEDRAIRMYQIAGLLAGAASHDARGDRQWRTAIERAMTDLRRWGDELRQVAQAQ